MRNLKLSRNLITLALEIMVILSLAFGTFFVHSSSRAAELSDVTLSSSAAQWIASAHLAGHHSSNDQMTIGLMLKMISLDQQHSLISSLYHPNSSSYHQWLSSAQFSQRYAPSQSSIAAAQSFLTQSGLHLVASPDASLQVASGTTSQVEAAFHTTINEIGRAHV